MNNPFARRDALDRARKRFKAAQPSKYSDIWELYQSALEELKPKLTREQYWALMLSKFGTEGVAQLKHIQEQEERMMLQWERSVQDAEIATRMLSRPGF